MYVSDDEARSDQTNLAMFGEGIAQYRCADNDATDWR